MSGIKYRREITGLRTVALLPVVLFHAGVPLFAGGFVGVDVFFVISGYLMASIIIKEREEGSFSLLGFYERRARRILPALIVVMLACIPFAWCWMTPDSLENFGQSLVASTLSGNNVLLYLTSGYWDLASQFKPLLHTWSLGVEEQFYLLFPFLLMLVAPAARKRLYFVFGLLAAVSLLISEWGARFYPAANFYLLPSRLWELLAGALCGLYLFHREPSKSEFTAAAGLLMILVAIFSYGRYTPFPSFYSLLPVVGTMMIILFGTSDTWTSKFLSTSWMVGLGLISYSAYLWHYPLFAFAHVYSFSKPALGTLLVLATASFVIAYFSWRYIEQPFRSAGRIGRRQLFMLLGLASAAIVAFGLYLNSTHGVPSRLFKASDTGAIRGMDISFNMRVFALKKKAFPGNGKSNLLVIGNSYARDFINAGLQSGHFSNLNVVYNDDGRLKGLPGSDPVLFGLIKHADYVVFAIQTGGVRFWRSTVAAIKRLGIRHYLIIGTKNFGYNQNAYMRLPRELRATARAKVLPSFMHINEEMKQSIPASHFVNLIGILSDGTGEMPVFAPDGFLISWDSYHLTRSGAKYVGEKLFRSPLLKPLR